MKHYYFALVVALALLGGCKSTELKPLGKSELGYRCKAGHQGPVLNLRHHVVQIDGLGVLVVNPKGAPPQLLGPPPGARAGTTASYLDTLFAHLNETGQRPHHVIVFVNGGLNSLKASTSRATRILSDDRGHMVLHPDTAFLFLNWNSSLNAYLEHLITHQGVVTPGGWGGVGRGFWGALNVTADAGRMVASLPLLAAQYYTQPGVWRVGTRPSNDLYRIDQPHPPKLRYETSQVNQQAYHLKELERTAPMQAICLDLGKSKRTGSFVHHYVTPAVLSSPGVFFLPKVPFTNFFPVLGAPWGLGFADTRLVTLIAADFVARPAWNSMLRRTQVMFVKPKPVERREDVARQGQQQQQAKFLKEERVRTSKLEMERGVVPQFVDRLVQYQQKRAVADGQPVTVTLMGHSMGTIVVSEILREEAQGPATNRLNCDAVVFMAAACPLRDVRTKVVPYLQANTATRFYNLTLHPYAELSENMLGSRKALGGPLLDGSLLVYIDRLLTNPLTPQERTAGRWHNFVLATTDTSFIPRDVRGRVTLKAFGAGTKPADGPQIHGDFSSPFLQEKVRNAQGKKEVRRYKYFFWSEEFRNEPAGQ